MRSDSLPAWLRARVARRTSGSSDGHARDVIEFVAAFIFPVIVSAAGHSDWVLPSIAITIGPLLLYLDRLVNIPRYRPVGWALTVGPVILVAPCSPGLRWSRRPASLPACCCSVPRSPASETSPVCAAEAGRRPPRSSPSQPARCEP